MTLNLGTHFDQLLKNIEPPQDILAAMEDNYCRCGAYHRIKRAIRRAAEVMAHDLREEVRP